MDSLDLVALRSFPYGSRTIQAGDRFRAFSQSDANALMVVGHATLPPIVEDLRLVPHPIEGTSEVLTTPLVRRRRAKTVSDGD